MNPAIEHLTQNFENHIKELESLVKIPSVSFPGFDHKILQTSANAVAELLLNSGLENVEILNLDGAFPYVYGDYLHAPNKPTLLLYAHHDVQPPGRDQIWQSKPFEPTRKQGPDGERLYGRGTADDKAGILIHTAAISAYLKSMEQLPVNVKVIIEGEEEIGSPHLNDFLQKYQNKLQADVMVLTDTANYDCSIPALTVGLRGMVDFGIEVRALNKTIHSGFWGGLVPDPAMALAKILSGLVDDKGYITLPEILAEVPDLTEQQKQSLEKLPFDDKRFKEQSGMIDSAKILKRLSSPMAQLWWAPSLTVNGIQSSSRAQPGNIINDIAWAKVTVRLAPGMRHEIVNQALRKYLKEHTPWGLELKIEEEASVDGWSIDPYGKHKPVFDLALRALETGYEKPAVFTGCGATIPFAKPFTKVLNDAPALLIGIEDPYTNAHGENESLLLSDFYKACKSQICLFWEFGQK